MIPFRTPFGGDSVVVQEFSTPGTYTSLAPPPGSTQVIIECYGGGCGAADRVAEEGTLFSGGAGGYARATRASQSVTVVVGAAGTPNWTVRGGDSYVSSSTNGQVLCKARGAPGNAGAKVDASWVGDLLNSGGNGNGIYYIGGVDGGPLGGGGAGGPLGPGGLGTRSAGGTGGGEMAGAGGRCATRTDTVNGVGRNYGGGGGGFADAFNGTTVCSGAPGFVRLTWI